MRRLLLMLIVPRWSDAKNCLLFLCLLGSLVGCSLESGVMVEEVWVDTEPDPAAGVHKGTMAILAFAGLLILASIVAGTGRFGSE